MIDIHCHLLPGIDDGPRSMADALSLARRCVANGICTAITTPHIYPGRFDNQRENLELAKAAFDAQLQANGIPLKVHLGAELHLSPEVLPLIHLDKVPYLGTLQGKQVLLLELPDSHIPPGTDKFIRWLADEGIRVLLAHPERNKEVMNNPGRIAPLLSLGCMLQLTAASVLGVFGSRAQRAAFEILDRDAAFAVATDTHSIDKRPPLLAEAYDFMCQEYGEQSAQLLCNENPASLLSDVLVRGEAAMAPAA